MTSTYSPAIQAQADARREFDALLSAHRWDLNSRRLPPATFDATFPPVEQSPGNRGWERVPAEFVGAVQLVLLGIRLRWVEVPPARSYPLRGHYIARGEYATDERLVYVPSTQEAHAADICT